MDLSGASLVTQLVKNLVGDLGLIPGLGRSPEGKGYPLQYSGLENSMDSPWGHRESDTTEQLSLHFHRPSFQTGSLDIIVMRK